MSRERHPWTATLIALALAVAGTWTIAWAASPVENLRAAATDVEVTLTWRPATEGALRIHRFEAKPPLDGRQTPEAGPVVAEVAAKDATFVDHQVRPGRVYVYRVAEVGDDGAEGELSAPVLAALEDRVPPAPPSALHAVVGDDGKVALEWTPSPSEDVAQVQLFRRIGPDGSWVVVRAFRPGVVRTEDRIDPWAGYTYHYAVAALDAGGNLSARSAPVEVRAPDHTPPAAPVVTGARSEPDGTVVVRWAPPGDRDVAGYRLLRGEAGKEPTEVAQVPSGATEAVDATAVPGVTYRYAVVAADGAGNASRPSAGVSARARAPAGQPDGPGAPTVRREADGVRLAWPAAEGRGLRGYFVYRSGDREAGFTKVSGLLADPEFMDPTSPAGAWYRVRAFYAGGRLSAPSEAAAAEEGKP